jgi:sn-glycerol 3-phosphate transport system ATP-binding protein
MATISLTDVNKRYENGAHAVRGVSMDITDGEFVVFVGPSGCGKSTLLRMVAGLESITEGEISIDERRINDVSPSERDVAMVFQNYALYPHMTVYKNMAYGLINRGLPKDEIKAKVTEVAKTLRIVDFLDRKPRQLSGGQRQRVAMGRAIVRSPKVFLFDEPLSNLDAKLRVQMRIEIKRLQREFGVTSIYVTHDQIEAMTLADRLAVINEGRVEQMGSPMELYSNPRTLFVASFIGSPQVNFLPASFDGTDLHFGETSLASFHDLPQETPLVLAIRPEHLREDDAGQIGVIIDLIEQLGADDVVYGAVQGMDSEEPLEICLRTHGSRHAPGDQMRLGFDAAQAMVFREDTGERLV